jgi:hypothetical protein
MKTALALSAVAIRAFSRDLAERIGAVSVQAQPGRMFFPKRIHEVGPAEGDVPDGLAADYITLAGRLNGRKSQVGAPDLLAVFLHAVEGEITRARATEARLLEAMGRCL